MKLTRSTRESDGGRRLRFDFGGVLVCPPVRMRMRVDSTTLLDTFLLLFRTDPTSDGTSKAKSHGRAPHLRRNNRRHAQGSAETNDRNRGEPAEVSNRHETRDPRHSRIFANAFARERWRQSPRQRTTATTDLFAASAREKARSHVPELDRAVDVRRAAGSAVGRRCACRKVHRRSPSRET